MNRISIYNWAYALIDFSISLSSVLYRSPAFQTSDDFIRSNEIIKTKWLIYVILDRHHVWRSLDPTLDISSNFMKEAIYLLFCILLKKMHFFHLFIQSFAPWPGLAARFGLAWSGLVQLGPAWPGLAWIP